MFDPNQLPAQCEAYFRRYLEGSVAFVHAEQLAKSTRNAPWKIDLRVNGVTRTYVLRQNMRSLEHEYRILRALMPLDIPAPTADGWEPDGESLGVPCFFSEYIEGESLLKPMVAAEAWAEALYLDAVTALQSITTQDLGSIATELKRESAADVLEDANAYFLEHPHPIAARAYPVLKETMPPLPALRFSNGDLWLDNFIVRDQKLAGVIDFENACFSDPVYEFLLSFFTTPALQGRGIEARFCQRLGVDPTTLTWYHGLEYFDTLRWVQVTGQPFEGHSVHTLEADLRHWLEVTQ